MHTLSEQLHATNMVRLAKGVCMCVFALGCYRCFGAAVLWLETGGCWNAVDLPVQ